LQRGGLAGAVRAEQRDDLPLLHLERDALQHEDHVVVDDLDVLYCKQRLGSHAPPQSKTADEGPPFCRSAVNAHIASLLQSRGVMPFSFAYCEASASILLRTSLRSGSIQSVMTFHFAPSHCWNLTRPEPSWSRHDTLSVGISPVAPSSFRRLSSMLRCSIPHRICSPVIGLPLPNLACAMRIASTVTMPATTPRVW